ncbi:signal recognition particle receptor, beta subunit, putative [Ixodes scapularis]|uniref:Signal recognition particle receptor subunit beta n=1 Tax=Ixodes scapularis TaxID=6945 RepID=B7QK99_IXOSC|nr:signal recognition particle receptor, beta subunit, putative [Ixodes scapularis]|eukprot:XP_002415606.1 signal recognition particle receptor, beta subunit, putative [Ixodes scapularis]
MAAEFAGKSERPLYAVKNTILGMSPVVLSIVVALVVLFITTVLLFRRRRNLRRAVLIVGLSDSGKTLLYSQLVAQKKVGTYTSIKENTTAYEVPKKVSFSVGNTEVGRLFVDRKFVRISRFMVTKSDSLQVPNFALEVAEFLYSLLSDSVLSQHCPPVLVVCNKQGMASLSHMQSARCKRHVNVLRATQASVLESTEGQANSKGFLGKKGKDFQFSDLKPLTVEFAEFSAEEPQESQLTALKSWLAKVA